jgi:hypothetical protein
MAMTEAEGNKICIQKFNDEIYLKAVTQNIIMYFQGTGRENAK